MSITDADKTIIYDALNDTGNIHVNNYEFSATGNITMTLNYYEGYKFLLVLNIEMNLDKSLIINFTKSDDTFVASEEDDITEVKSVLENLDTDYMFINMTNGSFSDHVITDYADVYSIKTGKTLLVLLDGTTLSSGDNYLINYSGLECEECKECEVCEVPKLCEVCKECEECSSTQPYIIIIACLTILLICAIILWIVK